jgi:release factor glutamine methyltransferase
LTLHEVLRAARERLVAGGIAPDEAAVDVELYARTILGWDAARLLTERAAPTPPALEPCFSEWIARRAQREPSAYIIGHREFWGLDYLVSPAVLIPRPESELIVEEALARLRDAEAPRLADVGTGSGCLGLSIAHDLPGARVVATDISREALAVARDNAVRLHVADRVMFLQTSYLDGVASAPFDAIVANPPYVKDTDKPALSRQVIAYEPHVALFGGDDGLRGVRGVLDAGRDRLRAGGWLITEFGLGQDEEVRELVGGYAMYRLESIKEDFQGIPRTAVIQRTIAP